MAISYSALVGLIDQTWINRVEASLVAAAIAISEDSPSAGLNTRRDALARTILRESSTWAHKFALAVALGFVADNNLTSDVTDGEIDTRVSAVYNDFLSQT